jgi:large subunit ribosomal protein L18
MKQTLRTVPFRRKREGKTNYRKRMILLKTRRTRIVVRPALQNMVAQLIQYNPKGDIVVVGVSSRMLKKFGWVVHSGNVPAAYLTGFLLGKRAMKKGITEGVLDTGLRTPVKGSKLYACVKGLKDAGVDLPVQEDVLPSDERIRGNHIVAHTGKKRIVDLFNQVKKSIEDKE